MAVIAEMALKAPAAVAAASQAELLGEVTPRYEVAQVEVVVEPFL